MTLLSLENLKYSYKTSLTLSYQLFYKLACSHVPTDVICDTILPSWTASTSITIANTKP
jgi:hypothetical protein